MSKKKTRPEAKSGRNKYLVPGIIVVIIAAVIFMLIPRKDQPLETPVPETPKYEFKKEGIVIFASPDGKSKVRIDVEIADTEYERTLGLMYRTGMTEMQGMLFVFPLEQPLSFWMKNTIMPLDMIYINSKREIVKIHKNTTPYSEQSYPSVEPAQYVVEVIAGFSDRHNIQPGDKVFWQ